MQNVCINSDIALSIDVQCKPTFRLVCLNAVVVGRCDDSKGQGHGTIACNNIWLQIASTVLFSAQKPVR